jgi:hypothetical protein
MNRASKLSNEHGGILFQFSLFPLGPWTWSWIVADLDAGQFLRRSTKRCIMSRLFRGKTAKWSPGLYLSVSGFNVFNWRWIVAWPSRLFNDKIWGFNFNKKNIYNKISITYFGLAGSPIKVFPDILTSDTSFWWTDERTKKTNRKIFKNRKRFAF